MSVRRRFTDDEKRLILREIEENGLAVTLRKHSIYAKSIYQWQEKFRDEPRARMKKGVLVDEADLRRLRMENLQLKEIVAEKELALRIKDALLKNHHHERGPNDDSTSVHRSRGSKEVGASDCWSESQYVLLSSTRRQARPRTEHAYATR